MPLRSGRRQLILLASRALAAAVLAASLGPSMTSAAAPAPDDAVDPLSARGWSVTGGAAPGYVDDEACAGCHRELWNSYQEVAMSRAFYPPAAERVIEKLGEPFHHPPSDRTYEMTLVDGRYVFTRYQLDDDGERINLFEQEVDWILGSGNHSRTYLFRTPAGELFQLPLAWYSQTSSWGMAPGYDRPAHLGVQRMVRRECMFCHNAYPDVAAGSDAYGQPHVFPRELPSGLGCQRCHGPGAAHVVAGLEGDLATTYLTIVNPAKLEPEERDGICYGCHMQPSVTVMGVSDFARADYSFRPGEALDDFKVQIDVVEQGKARSERFEINHHPYRLEQSKCFTESDGRLGCLTCHDPHRKVPAAERAAWYGERCRSCHDLATSAAHAGGDPGDCVSCHMPERRTQDVVQVTMTDHLIRRRPPGPEAVAPLAERPPPIIVDASLLYPERAPQIALVDAYRAATVIRAGGGTSAAAVDRLERLLAETPLPEVAPWLNLAMGQLRLRRFDAVEETAAQILARAPDHSLALEWLGLARQQSGRGEAALDAARRAAAAPDGRSEARFNLALLLLGDGQLEEGRAVLERAVAARPNLSAAWYYLGAVERELERSQQALAALRRALAIEPTMGRAYVALGELLLERGERDEALRYLRHGARAARDPRPVAAALAKALSAAEEDAGEDAGTGYSSPVAKGG